MFCDLRCALNGRDTLTTDIAPHSTLFRRYVLVDEDLTLRVANGRLAMEMLFGVGQNRVLSCLTENARLSGTRVLGGVSDNLTLAALAYRILCCSSTFSVVRRVKVTGLDIAADIYACELFEFRPADLNIIVRLFLSRALSSVGTSN